MSKTIVTRIKCHSAEELGPYLEAEVARCRRSCTATQLLGLRLFAEGSVSPAGFLAHLCSSCDALFNLGNGSAVLLQPRQDEDETRALADSIMGLIDCPCALLQCSIPDSLLLARGARRVLSFFEQSLAKASPDCVVQVVRLPGRVLQSADEARVSVEEKNFLFSC